MPGIGFILSHSPGCKIQDVLNLLDGGGVCRKFRQLPSIQNFVAQLRVTPYRSGWPSGLRRQTQVLVLDEGVGSNPTSDTYIYLCTNIVLFWGSPCSDHGQSWACVAVKVDKLVPGMRLSAIKSLRDIEGEYYAAVASHNCSFI